MALAHRRPSGPELRTAARLTRWLDDRLLDPLLGLVLPGAGDLVGAGLGFYLVWVALRARLPKIVVARMLVNLAVDTIAGAIPIFGDLFDVAFRSNRRNLRLLEARYAEARARPRDWLYVLGAAALALVALAVPLVLFVWALRTLF